MAGKIKTKSPVPFIEVLPKEAINMDFDNGEIHWEIEDLNDSIIFTYDIHTRFIYWDSVNTEEHGRYFKRVHRPKDLEKAIEEWHSDKRNWDENFNTLPF